MSKITLFLIMVLPLAALSQRTSAGYIDGGNIANDPCEIAWITNPVPANGEFTATVDSGAILNGVFFLHILTGRNAFFRASGWESQSMSRDMDMALLPWGNYRAEIRYEIGGKLITCPIRLIRQKEY